jgi:hypothetical protein
MVGELSNRGEGGWLRTTGKSSRGSLPVLDELRNRLDVAEDANQIAAIYALEEEINELETARKHLLHGLIERVVDEAAA